MLWWTLCFGDFVTLVDFVCGNTNVLPVYTEWCDTGVKVRGCPCIRLWDLSSLGVTGAPAPFRHYKGQGFPLISLFSWSFQCQALKQGARENAVPQAKERKRQDSPNYYQDNSRRAQTKEEHLVYLDHSFSTFPKHGTNICSWLEMNSRSASKSTCLPKPLSCSWVYPAPLNHFLFCSAFSNKLHYFIICIFFGLRVLWRLEEASS